MFQPKTGKRCTCRAVIQRDNCANCEGTGFVVDFAAIRNKKTPVKVIKVKQVPSIDVLDENFNYM